MTPTGLLERGLIRAMDALDEAENNAMLGHKFPPDLDRYLKGLDMRITKLATLASAFQFGGTRKTFCLWVCPSCGSVKLLPEDYEGSVVCENPLQSCVSRVEGLHISYQVMLKTGMTQGVFVPADGRGLLPSV